MATLIDEGQVAELELAEGETLANIDEDTPVEPVAQEEPVVEEPEPEQDTPASKYEGKSHAEMVAILEERERMIGQQSNELGNLRSTFDAMAKAQSVPAEPEPEPVEEADFFVDPQKAVDARIHNHPALKEAREMAQKLAYAQSLATLQQRHPDLQEVMDSDGFKQWITASPSRVRRLQNADQTGDVDEADDLISTYKEVTRTVNTAKRVEKQAQKKAVKNASVSAPRSNPDAASSKRVYRRADIIELMKERPDRFEALEAEIIQAYAEGRVRD